VVDRLPHVFMHITDRPNQEWPARAQDYTGRPGAGPL